MEIIIIIVSKHVYRRFGTYRIRIAGNIIVCDKLISVYLTGNIRIVVLIVLGQIVLFTVFRICFRLCVSESLDREIVKSVIRYNRLCFSAFVKFCLTQLSRCIVIHFCIDLNNIPLCGTVIICQSIIQVFLSVKLSYTVTVIHIPRYLLALILVIIGSKSAAVLSNRNNTVRQNVRNNRKTKRSLLSAVYIIIVYWLFTYVIIRGVCILCILIPPIFIFNVNIEPVYFTLSFCIILFNINTVHLVFILADGFADSGPCSYQRLSLDSSCTCFSVNISYVSSTIRSTVLIISEWTHWVAVAHNNLLILDIISVHRRCIWWRCTVNQTSKLTCTRIAVPPINRVPHIIHSVSLIMLSSCLSRTIPVIDVINLVVVMVLAVFGNIRSCQHSVVPVSYLCIGKDTCRNGYFCNVTEIASSVKPLVKRILNGDLNNIRNVFFWRVESRILIRHTLILLGISHILRSKILRILCIGSLNKFNIYFVCIYRSKRTGVTQSCICECLNIYRSVAVKYRLHSVSESIGKCYAVQSPVTVVISF